MSETTTAQIEFPTEPMSGLHKVGLVLLITLALVVGLWGQGAEMLLSDHEAIVAQSARQMRMGDGWLIPMFNDVPRIRKPPLSIWLVAAASYITDTPQQKLPVNAYAARLPSAITLVLTVLMVYSLARSMFSPRTGLLAGAIMALSAGGFYFAHNAQTEMLLMLTCTGAFACFWIGTEQRRRGFIVLFYAFFGLAMMAKAPLPVAVVGLPLAVWWLLTVPLVQLTGGHVTPAPSMATLVWRQVRRLPEVLYIPGILVALLIFVPWPLYVYYKMPNALDLWRLEFFGRYAGELGKSRPVWYYVPILFGYLFPFMLSLPEAVASPFLARFAARRKPLLYLFTWAIVAIGFLSTSPFKRPHYMATVIPALALLLAPTIEAMFFELRRMARGRVLLTGRTLMVVIPLALVGGGVAMNRILPDLLRAYIVLAVVFSIGTWVSVGAFLARRRVMSLAVLGLMTLTSYAWGFDALARSGFWQHEVREMVAQFRAHGIGPKDRITWVAGRPNASVAFYLGQEISPLFSPLELAPMRGNRREIARDLLVRGGERLVERLSSKQAEYFVISEKYWKQFKEEARPPAREVFRVSQGIPPKPGKDLIVITNDWNTEGESGQ